MDTFNKSQTQNKNQKPIKKFTRATEIKHAVKRFNINQRNKEWEMVPRADIMSLIIEAINTRKVPYNGTAYVHTIPKNMRMEELIEHFSVFGIPTSHSYSNLMAVMKMKLKPFFYHTVFKYYRKELPAGNGVSLDLDNTMTYQDLMKNYEIEEKYHKISENHHPGTIGWDKHHSDYQEAVHVEAVIDVFSSMLRQMTLEKAWKALLGLLANRDSSYNKLQPCWVAVALLHIRVRGVFEPRFFQDTAHWRKCTPEGYIERHHYYTIGIPMSKVIAAYKHETIIHQDAVNSEIMFMRYGKINHDHTKFSKRSIFFYSWRWGVWEGMPDTYKNRMKAGCASIAPPDTKFTVLEKVGKEFASGMADSLKKTIDDHSAMIDEKIEKVATKMEDVGEKMKDGFFQSTQSLISEFFQKATTYTDETASKFAREAKNLLGQLPEDIGEISSALTSFKLLFESSINAYVTKFKDYLPEGFTISIDALLDALKYYIIIVNTENKFLRALLFFGILNSFGLVRKAIKWIGILVTYLKGPTEKEEQEPSVDPQFTSDYGISEKIGGAFSSLTSIGNILIGYLGSVFSGKVLSASDFSSLISKTANLMKNFHFIGGGILGITRIYEFGIKIVTKVIEWVREKIFKQTPERKIIAKQVIVWVLKVRYFASESGMNAIRMSPSAREVANKLFAEGQALLSQVSSTSPNYSRELLADIQRYWSDVKTVSNYVSRINAMSAFQPTMFHVQLCGAAGIGKSTLTKSLTYSLLKSIWKGGNEHSFWSYNPNLEYFDGYAGQKIMIVDDMFRYQDPKHLTTLIGLITNTPVILPMANLEDKGCQLSSEIMISSTNTPYPPSKDVLCMEAVHRRRHMLVNVVMDPRVRNDGTGQFDSTLYNKFYPKEKGFKKEDFPHLRFHLIRSVPRNTDLHEALVEGKEVEETLKQYAAKLKKGNQRIIMTGFGEEIEIDPMFLYDEDDPPPTPLRLPCHEWTYRQFLTNTVLRFNQFRGMESTYTRKEKFSHVQTSFAEIDAIFAQAADIPGEAEMEKIKLIESMFLDVNTPFGMDDPLGQKIYESEDTLLAPELEKIDLEKVFNDKVEAECEGKKFTSDDHSRLTLEEEATRRRLLLQRKNKTIQDPIMKHVLEQKKFIVEQEDGLSLRRFGIKMDPSFTVWQGPTELSEYMGDSRLQRLNEFEHWLDQNVDNYLEDALKQDRFYQLSMLTKGDSSKYIDFLKWFRQICLSSNVVIPRNEVFDKEQWGKTLNIPIGFLNQVEWHGIDPYFMQKHEMPRIGMIQSFLGGKMYEVPYDGAYIWSTCTSFRNWLMEFDNLTPSQQKALVEDAKWRNQYTGFYTIAKLEKDVTIKPLKKILKAFSFFLDPVYELVHNFPIEFAFFSSVLVLIASVKLLISLTSLIVPKKAEPTSKYLHRGPPSAIQHRPAFTSLFENKTFDHSVKSVLNRNVKEVVITDVSGNTARCQGLLTGQYLYVNKHVFLNINTKENLLVSLNKQGEDAFWDYIITPKNLVMDDAGDLACIYSKSIPSARNIEAYLVPTEKYKTVEIGSELLFLSRSGVEYGIEHNALIGIPKKRQIIRYNGAKDEMISNEMVLAEGTTVVGKSGSPVVYTRQISGSFAILGIQAWMSASTRQIYIQVITREKAKELQEKLIAQLEEIPVLREEDYEPTEVNPSLTKAFTSADFNNIITSVSQYHSAGIVGKTQFLKTPIANLMDRDGFESERIPAALDPKDPRLAFGQSIHPLNSSLNKTFKDSIIAFTPNTLDYIGKNLVNWFKFKLDKKSFKQLGFAETVTGTREDGSNPMNLKTSPGIPYIYEIRKQRGKKEWLRISEEGELDYVADRVVDDYLEFKAKMKNGIIPLNVAYDFPKDELRPKEKVTGSIEKNTPPKTRSVTCMNMMYVLLWRELTLDMWAAFHRAADGQFPLCPGINPEGPEWSSAFYYLSKFNKSLDFDVSNWDGYFPPQFAFLIGDIICELNDYPKNSPEELAIRAIMTDLMYGYVQYGRVIYQKGRGMISGFPGTAELNSMAHLILIIYIYLELTVDYPHFNNFQAFLDHVRCLIYGDDIILSFSDEISEIFNGLTISEMYRSIGYPVTSADKNSEIVKYKELGQCQFLKSTWNEIAPALIVRKMELSVAYDLLYWVRAKEHPLGQFYDNLVDALRIAFGHGETEYTKFLKRVNEWLRERNLEPLMFSFDDLLLDHIRKYYI
nr:putative RdRp [Linepithema humile polycipivirus 1]